MSFTLWFTGLSGSGKTTLSRATYFELLRRDMKAELLDGDIIRTNFSQELGFNKRDRDINVKRIGFVAHLLNRHGVAVIVAAIAPYAETRDLNRALIDNYVEAYVNCPLETAEQRDVKGLYARARAGEIAQFTGITSPYEPPENPEIEVRTDLETEEESFHAVLQALEQRGCIPRRNGGEDEKDVVEEEQRRRERLAELGFARKDGLLGC